MISSFKLKFGRVPGSEGELVTATPVTVFVGPNNSGKSLVLTEIEGFCRAGSRDANARLLSELTFSVLSPAAAAAAIERLKGQPRQGERVIPGYVFIQGRGGRQQVPLEDFTRYLQNPSENPKAFSNWFLTYFVMSLDGKSRINLIGEQEGGDLQLPPKTSFQVLYHDASKRLEVRRILAEAFGYYFILDLTNLGKIRIRLSARAPRDEQEELNVNPESVKFQGAAQLIDLASDGVKAFTGIVAELLAGDPRVVLIDEPEAFLHPSLASKLGLEISRAAVATDKRVFVATHSAAFLMGCIQSGAPVTIVRLTYRTEVPTARVLPSQEIKQLMRNPLLRSTGVLNGLLYDFVVVAEGDSDRAFYQEINERLLQYKPEWGIPNCLFIHAQNKQTIPTILQPLRKMGIPAAGIVDIDVLKDGGAVWTRLLESLSVPVLLQEPWGRVRSAINDAMVRSGRNMKRDGGLTLLTPENRESADNLFNQLADYGMFVVPGGEVESWLRHLAVQGHGPEWLIAAFERMGEDPEQPNYLRPGDDDVWEFMSRVKRWLFDARRRGIPE